VKAKWKIISLERSSTLAIGATAVPVGAPDPVAHVGDNPINSFPSPMLIVKGCPL